MPKEIFEVTRERFHLLDRNKYIVQGSWPKEAKVEVCLDSQKLPVKVEKLEIVSAMDAYTIAFLICFPFQFFPHLFIDLCQITDRRPVDIQYLTDSYNTAT